VAKQIFADIAPSDSAHAPKCNIRKCCGRMN
jgi:hypothetical protein